MKKIIAALVLAPFIAPHVAMSAEKTLIVAERRSRDGREQVSLRLEGNELRIISNTNVLDRDSKTFRVGLLTTAATAELKREIENISERATLEKTSIKGEPATHDVHVYVNGTSLSPMASAYVDSMKLLVEAMSRRDLVEVDVERITRTTSSALVQQVTDGKVRGTLFPAECLPSQKICRTRLAIIHLK